MSGVAESKLLPIARELHALKSSWWVRLRDSGELDEAAYEAMVAARRKLFASPPETLFDCLLLCGAIRCVARYGMLAVQGEKTLDGDLTEIAQATFNELAVSTTALTSALETLAGV